MNKSQFVDELAKRFDGNKKVAQHALDSVVDVITRSVASGERVVITGFGAFERGVRQAGTARNPRTGAVVKTSKRFVPKFRAGSDLKHIVNDARAVPKRVIDSLAVVPATAVSAARAAAAGQKPPSQRTATAKKTAAPATKTTAKKTTAKKTTATKTTAKKTTAKKTTVKKAAAKKAPATKTTAKTTQKKASARTPAKKA